MSIQKGVPCQWMGDSKHFILYNFNSIQDCPSRVYISALTLYPSSSWLHKYHTPDMKCPRVVLGSTEWDTCTHTIPCLYHATALAYSGNLIATSPTHGDIHIIGALTGSQTAVLSGHTGNINSLSFSLDGRFLVSGSFDKTVKLWDIQTGRIVKTFSSHTKPVTCVAISADNAVIVSGSKYETMYLWDVETGNYCTIDGGGSFFESVAFSPLDPQLLFSTCTGSTTRQWSIDGHKIGPPVDGHHCGFSPDGTQSIIWNGEVITFRTASGESVVEFNLVGSNRNCCLSPDGRLIASFSGQNIYVWDITNSTQPCKIHTLTGHLAQVTAIVFSSPLTLTSVSKDRTIKFWQIGTSPVDPASTKSTFSAKIISVSLQAKDGLAFSMDILTGHCNESYQIQTRNPSSADIQLVNGRVIVVWCEWNRKEIHVLDIEKDGTQPVPTARNISIGDSPIGLRIIGDGSRVVHIGLNFIQAWSI